MAWVFFPQNLEAPWEKNQVMKVTAETFYQTLLSVSTVTALHILQWSLGGDITLTASGSWRRWGPPKLVLFDIAGILKQVLLGCTDSLKPGPEGSMADI